MGSIEAIPTVDISAWIDTSGTEEERQRAVDEMRNACTRYGFFNLIGHGVSPQAQSQALNCAKLFFILSEQEKMDVCISKSIGRSFRGYERPGIQVHQEGLLPDTKEVGSIVGMRYIEQLMVDLNEVLHHWT